MSKLESPMTRRYWERIGGTLIEEFPLVLDRPGVRRRQADAVIIVDGEHRIASWRENLSLEGHDVIVVQSKARQLGMNLFGQALGSRELILRRFTPKSVRTIALCATDDAALRPIAESYGVEVVVDAGDETQASEELEP